MINDLAGGAVWPYVEGVRASHKRFARVGPGGMECACCAPAPGKEKKAFLRQAKKREKRESLNEAWEEVG